MLFSVMTNGVEDEMSPCRSLLLGSSGKETFIEVDAFWLFIILFVKNCGMFLSAFEGRFPATEANASLKSLTVMTFSFAMFVSRMLRMA